MTWYDTKINPPKDRPFLAKFKYFNDLEYTYTILKYESLMEDKPNCYLSECFMFYCLSEIEKWMHIPE